MADRVGFDLPCGAGRLAALGCPRQPIHYRSGSNPNERSSKKKTATLSGDCFFLADRVGFDLRCGGGRVAALERPRRSIHYRSRSNPLQVFQKRSPRHKAGASLLADRVGFEPTSLLRDYLISSQGRYDHFDTCPSVCCAIIPKAQEKIKPNLNQIVHI